MSGPSITPMAQAVAEDPELQRLRKAPAARKLACVRAYARAHRDQRGLDRLVAALRGFPRRWRGPGALGAFIRMQTLDAAGRYRDAAELTAAVGAAAGGDVWLRYYSGNYRLQHERDHRGAAADYRAALKAAPGMWKARAYLAEIDLCRGRTAAALAAMAELIGALPDPEREEARAWRGAMQLWLGRPAAALAELAGPAERGLPFARGWRGAALVHAGRRAAGERELDAELARHPEDEESRVWRAELYRLNGRAVEAAAELDDLLASDLHFNFWAAANRALICAARGEHAALSRLSERTDEEIVAALCGKRARPATPKAQRAMFAKGLKRGRGLRSNALYLRPLWLGTPV